MSKVVKYYYSRPIYKATITMNPIVDKTVISNVRQSKRYTIAVVYDDEDRTIKFGLATCLPSDNFCKAIGRDIAQNNAIKNPFHTIIDFSGRRNKYADKVMDIVKKMELKLLKRDNPNLFNPDCFIN